MSPTHKAALAEGREQGRVVRRYLEALEAHKPKRGRKRTPESIKRRLAAIDQRLASADPLNRLQLTQEQMNLQNELAGMENKVDLGALEEDFVKVAASYGQRKGISYNAWRAAGVDAGVLRRASISRGTAGERPAPAAKPPSKRAAPAPAPAPSKAAGRAARAAAGS